MSGDAIRTSRLLAQRKYTIRFLLALVMQLSALGCGSAPSSSPNPNVILITLDTTRADHLGVYGYERNISPQIDQFAQDAVTYDRAWATGAWTLPTHASMLTGRLVSNHGARFAISDSNVALSAVFEGDFFAKHKASRLPEDEVTLAELLSERGYATAAFGGGPWLAPPFGLMQGYQLADTEVTSVEGRSAADLTDRMIAWLGSVPADQPIHALINFFDPHSPYDPPPGFDDLPGARIPLIQEQDQIFINAGARLGKVQRTAVIDRYDGEIRYMDFHLGRLLAALRDAGRYEDSFIIVVGDHGELFGEHGFMGHGRWLYEGVLRVPLIVHHPGGPGAGTRESALVSQVDLLPMIAAKIDLPLPQTIDGLPIGTRTRVLAEAFRDPFSVNHLGKRYDRDLRALVQWPHKLIRSDTGRSDVYDLDRDPLERLELQQPRLASALEGSLQAEVGRLEARSESTPPTGVGSELQENLRRLGYIE
jgi:arylsulfatase A-like enzyme